MMLVFCKNRPMWFDSSSWCPNHGLSRLLSLNSRERPSPTSPSDKVTVQIEVLPRANTKRLVRTEFDVARHACTHLSRDIRDDRLVTLIEQLVFGDDLVELDEQLTILLVRPALVKFQPGCSRYL